MPYEFPVKEKYDIEDLLDIMKKLRDPENGCPWDKVQTHDSIQSSFLEETHEALEAIREQDTDHLREELGDVLFQVVFHSQIEAEKESFDFSDVVDGICRKMLIRHPHVFGDLQETDPDKLLKNWDSIKKVGHHMKTQSEVMDSVPKTLPALMRADKVIDRGSRVGCRFSDEGSDDAVNIHSSMNETGKSLTTLLTEEIQAIATNEKSKETTENEDEHLGRLLFLTVALCRSKGMDAEQLLMKMADCYIRHFGEEEKKETDFSSWNNQTIVNRLLFS